MKEVGVQTIIERPYDLYVPQHPLIDKAKEEYIENPISLPNWINIIIDSCSKGESNSLTNWLIYFSFFLNVEDVIDICKNGIWKRA